MNLLTESDCLKWLGDFEEKTNTEWKVDKDATRISQSNKVTIRVLHITNYYMEHTIFGEGAYLFIESSFWQQQYIKKLHIINWHLSTDSQPVIGRLVHKDLH